MGLGAAASLALLIPAASFGAQTPPTAADAANADWSHRTASVRLTPERLLRRAPGSGSIRLTYVQAGPDGPVVGTHVVDGREAARRSIARLQDDSRTIAVEVDTPRALTGVTRAATTPKRSLAAVSADPKRSQQWAMDRLQGEDVWPTTDGTGVTVAVLDSGVAEHSDLAGSFVPGKDFVDTGGTGRSDPNGHGTHVAGIIAMTANNGVGGAGLAPGVSIMPVRVATADGIVYASASARGLVWAADHGAQVVNMSYSGSYSPVEETAVEYALSKGVTLVAAAGNEYLDETGVYYNPVRFPAGYSDVVGVAAYSRKGARAFFSEVGDQVDLAAPGGGSRTSGSSGLILSTYNDGGYTHLQGTSMAAPYVTASAALVASRATTLGVTVDVPEVLMATATDMGARGVDREFGYGGVNPAAAVTMITEAPKLAKSSRVTLVPMDASVSRSRVKFRIPARGKFEVAVQQKGPNRWGKARLIRKAAYNGGQVYHLRADGGGTYRILARVAKDRDSNPVWYSPILRIRG